MTYRVICLLSLCAKDKKKVYFFYQNSFTHTRVSRDMCRNIKKLMLNPKKCKSVKKKSKNEKILNFDTFFSTHTHHTDGYNTINKNNRRIFSSLVRFIKFQST